jgi:hypothetical protein
MINKIKNEYDIPNIFKKELIIKIAILCVNKIISSLINNLNNTFNIFLKSGARINFFITYDDDIINGYIGSKNKINEIFISNKIKIFDGIIEEINKDKNLFKYPLIFLTKSIYRNLNKEIKENFIIWDILNNDNNNKVNLKRKKIIYRQFIDTNVIKNYELDNYKERKDIIKERNVVIKDSFFFNKFIKENKDNFDNIIRNYFDKFCNEENKKIIVIINNAYKEIYKNKNSIKGKNLIKMLLNYIKENKDIYLIKKNFTKDINRLIRYLKIQKN